MDSRVIYITNCTRRKDPHPVNILSAVERYLGKNIKTVYDIALNHDREMFILSGKFGLIHSDELIPDYDKLLFSEDVKDLVKLVKQKLIQAKVKEVVFYSNGVHHDANLDPYHATIEYACEELNIDLTFVSI